MKATVTIIESERGWGQKVDEIREFDSMDDAWEFYHGFNSQNNQKKVPDIYWFAREPQPVAT